MELASLSGRSTTHRQVPSHFPRGVSKHSLPGALGYTKHDMHRLRSKVVTSFSSNAANPVELIKNSMYSLYGKYNCQRIVDSLELNLSQGEVVNYIEGKGEQRASSFLEGLRAIPYHDVHNGQFPWLEKLETEYLQIRNELNEALENPDLSSIGNSIWVPAARDDAIAYGPSWRTLVLQDRCQWEETNTKLFPATTRLLRDAACPSVEVFFARQPPKTGIKPHTDNTNFILTAHVGLDVPEDLSWMQVGDFKKYWKNGEALVADTSFIHSTANESETDDRYVLIVRFWHPDMSEVERQAMHFLFDALDDPTKSGILVAERQAKSRMPPGGRRRNKKANVGDGLGLLSKGMR